MPMPTILFSGLHAGLQEDYSSRHSAEQRHPDDLCRIESQLAKRLLATNANMNTPIKGGCEIGGALLTKSK